MFPRNNINRRNSDGKRVRLCCTLPAVVHRRTTQQQPPIVDKKKSMEFPREKKKVYKNHIKGNQNNNNKNSLSRRRYKERLNINTNTKRPLYLRPGGWYLRTTEKFYAHLCTVNFCFLQPLSTAQEGVTLQL